MIRKRSRFVLLWATVIMASLSLFIGCATSDSDTQAEDSMMAIGKEEGTNADVGDAATAADSDTADIDANAEEPTPARKNKADSDSLEAENNDEFNDDTLDDSPKTPESLDAQTTPREAPSADQAPAPVPEPTVAEPSVAGRSVQITNIKFLSNKAGGTVVIETDGPAVYQTRSNPDLNQFVIEVSNANLPKRLTRPYLMNEFGAAFAAVNAYQSPGSSTARIVIQLKDKNSAAPVVEQEGNSLVVVPGGASTQVAETDGEASKEESASSDKQSYDVHSASEDEKVLGARSLDQFLQGNNKYYGSEISIQTKDADIRDVINFIADQSGVNLIVSDEVNGKVSLKLRKVPWDQALVTVMRAKGLGYVRQGNVLRISSLKTLNQEATDAKSIIDSQKAIEPLKVKVLPINYEPVDDLAKNIKSFLSKDRGAVVADNRTSTLVITDTDEVIQRITRLIKELDKPPTQVLVEGKIVEASDEFHHAVGINWGFSGASTQISGSGGINGSAVNLTPNLSVQPVSKNTLGGAPFALGLTVGTLDVIGSLNSTLALLETDSVVKILSSPRIFGLNKEKLSITQKSENVTTQSTRDPSGTVTTTITRTPIVLDLTVTPQITSDASVIMDVEVKQEFPGGLVSLDSTARPVNSRTAKTKILVKNAQTAVIGGIYTSNTTEGENGVPVLKDIPVLGWLFKSKTKDLIKNELIIFLTPKVLGPTVPDSDTVATSR